MKRIVMIFLMSVILFSSSCSNEQKVVSYEIIEGQTTVVLGTDFNEDSLIVKVTFDDNTSKTYSSQDMEFDYTGFDKNTSGAQFIGITIKETGVKFKINVSVIENSFRLLMIGNSYSDDTIQWVHEICDDLGIDFTIANLYIGGCTLATHLNNLNYDRAAYEYVSYNKFTKTWSRKPNTSIYEALDFEDWNYISLQQASSQSGFSNTYQDIDAIIDLVLDYKDNVKFIWNMTWAYQQNSGHANFGNYNNNQMTMYNAILNAVKENVLTNDRIDLIVPNGTAVQNARTSFIGDNLTRDVHCHLTYDLGRYIAGLTLVAALTSEDISKIKYAPMNLTEHYKQMAIESVLNAINNPFSITQSEFKEDQNIDLSGYVEIDYQPVGCAYYVSTDTINYNKLVTTATNSMNFIASKVFTKDELPVGSIIEVKTGYQYRPEGWIGDKVQSTRPDNVSMRYVKVTDEWWGNYTKRSFNISLITGASLMYRLKDAIEAFSIYVPKDLYEEPTGNLYSENDKVLFTYNNLDINNYELYDYIYSNGFYNSSIYPNQQIDFMGDLATKFICTESFDKIKLPVGSVLIIDSGYQYRPDAWNGNAATNPRPNNVTTNFIVIDSLWWGNYTIKAFNISKTDGSVINQSSFDTSQHFRIYIPKN